MTKLLKAVKRGSRYLVQTRNTGESWRTVDSYPEMSWAANVADNCAAERTPFGPRGPGWNGCSRYNYVRVAHKGITVYDPRHVDNVVPGPAPAPVQPSSPQRD